MLIDLNMYFILSEKIKQIKSNYLSIYQYVACFCLFIFIFNKVLAFTHIEINILRHLAKNLCYLLAIANIIIFIKEKNYLVVILSLLFIVVGVLNKKYTQQSDVLLYSILVLSFSKLNFRAALQVFIFTVGILLISIMLFSLLDLSDDEFFGLRNGKLRYAFGFRHSNFLGGMIFFFTMTLWVSIKDKLINNILFIMLFVMEYLFIDYYVDSRTAQVMSIIVSLVIVIYGIFTVFSIKINNLFLIKCIKFFAVYYILVIAAIHIFIVYLYLPNNELFVALDKLFSTRISLQNNALQNFSLSLFGDISYSTLSDEDPFYIGSISARSYNLLDSFYLYVLYRWGLFSLIIFLISTIIVSWQALKQRQFKIIIALFCFSIYAINENYYFMICYNIFIYLCFSNISLGDKKLCQKSQC